jgi:hypothetical protein
MSTTYESATADLLAAIERVVGPWLARCVTVACDRAGGVPDEVLVNQARAAAGEGATWVMRRLRDALEADVDAQRANPLQILREAVRFPTEVLSRAGVPPAKRDEMDERINPDDVYALAPAHWNDIDESLLEPGIVWGAAKAQTVLQRRRAEGKLD